MKEQLAEQISEWIRKKVRDAGAKGVVLGLSGGLDSALASVLCKRAFPNSTLALIMPCHSNSDDAECASLVAYKFNLETENFDLSNLVENIYETLEDQPYENKPSVPVGNLKARLRMLFLYYFANKLNYLVVGTGTRSEIEVGYFTKFGDGAADLLPLGDLLKNEVRELARRLKIPKKIIDRAPSAGLWKGQTDEEEMGLPYKELDQILLAIESDNLSGFDEEKVNRVEQLMNKAKHKRQKIPIFKRERSK
jgi:NAD+ synthase